MSDRFSLASIRSEPTADLTLRNLMEALRVTYELRARYKVFEFEASQEGHPDAVTLFASLSAREDEQAAALMRGLRSRLAREDGHVTPGEAVA